MWMTQTAKNCENNNIFTSFQVSNVINVCIYFKYSSPNENIKTNVQSDRMETKNLDLLK